MSRIFLRMELEKNSAIESLLENFFMLDETYYVQWYEEKQYSVIWFRVLQTQGRRKHTTKI